MQALDTARGTNVASQFVREMPMGVAVTSGGSTAFQSLNAFRAANPGCGEAIRAITEAHKAGTAGGVVAASGAMDGLRHEMNQLAGPLHGQNASVFYPDAVKGGGTAIEIKGPGDREGPDQFTKYADTSPDKRCMVIDAQSCGDGTQTTPGGRCRAQAAA